MLTNQTTPHGGLSEFSFVIWIGVAAHYLVGIFFAFCYYFLWQQGIGTPTFMSGLLFGVINGLFGIAVWSVVFRLHPNPPQTVSLKVYFPALVAAHLVFGAFLNLTYSTLVRL